MDYCQADLERADADLVVAERQREWMSGVVGTLRARSLHSRAAERQLAHFAAMTAALRQHRKDIESAILARRERVPS